MKDEVGKENAVARQGENDLAERTKRFALRIIKLYVHLPKDAVGQILGKQILRSGTSVGAQYREAFRARSTAEFISKVECVLQELDETSYWLDLLVEGEVIPIDRLHDLRSEAEQLISIFVTAVKTAKQKR